MEEEIQGTSKNEELKHPMGRKRTKVMDARVEVDANKIKVAGASLEAQEKRNRLIEEQHESLLLISKKDDRDQVVRKYIQIKRRRAFECLKASKATN